MDFSTLVRFFLLFFWCRLVDAGIGDHDQAAIDEIRAYIDSLEENPSLHYWKPADIDKKIEERGDLSPRAAVSPPEPTCKAKGGCSEEPSMTSFDAAAGLLGTGGGGGNEKDFANMNMGQLMNELIELTQKHPEEVESVMEMYKQMISTAKK